MHGRVQPEADVEQPLEEEETPWSDEQEESDEEVTELEFNSAIDKIRTHTPFCLICRCNINKVGLRRRERDVGIQSDIGRGHALHDVHSGSNMFMLSGHGLPLILGVANCDSDHAAVEQGITSNLSSNQIFQQASLTREILRCIVNGGLMASIITLSVMSYAIASNATTPNVICIGLATVVNGLILLGHHLLDLRSERHTSGSGYGELLVGRRGHLLLHSSFAILSFLVFGLTPPLMYGFAFHESDNKDYKILAVSVSSFTCILVLAGGKAYVRQICTLGNYIKTMMYYVTLAVSVLGVAYAAGNFIKALLMVRLGWFEPETTPAGLRVTDMVLGTRAWGSY